MQLDNIPLGSLKGKLGERNEEMKSSGNQQEIIY